MAKKNMVDKLINLIRKVKAEKGDIALFMLIKTIEELNKWSVIISAPWIHRTNSTIQLDYWIEQIRSALNENELSNLNKISLLEMNNPIVESLTSYMNVNETSTYFKDTKIGTFYINEAIILESHKIINTDRRTRVELRSVNPIYNHTINPIYNHSINPIFNQTINPIYNHTINPIFNQTINPIYNHTINPIYNHTINPIFNHTINPVFNHTINPVFNHTINPIFNPSYLGPYFYDNSGSRLGFFVTANDAIKIFYNNENANQSYTIQADNNLNLYDINGQWIGYFCSDGSDGYNYFTLDTTWRGYIK